MTVHYFSPGPASLPIVVRNRIKDELLDTFGIGVSVMEISHRSKQYGDLNAETLTLAKKVFAVPDTHSVLFSVCGAQQHFSLLIQHLSYPGDELAYTNTGVWSRIAYEEALGSNRKIHLVYDGSETNHVTLEGVENCAIPAASKFVHLTVNNTVCGTEYKTIPTFGKIPLVLDMTSSLGARNDIPWNETGLVYASAQKNFGIAGVSVVIMRNDLLEQSRTITKNNFLGKALSYHAAFDAHSILNTPPVIPIFAMNRMLQWIDSQGGVVAMEKIALAKAKIMYDAMDGGLYIPHSDPRYRSRHNFVFKLPTEQEDLRFIEEAKKHDLLEIRGYKTIGGIRASIYNGISLESTRALADFMHDYRSKL